MHSPPRKLPDTHDGRVLVWSRSDHLRRTSTTGESSYPARACIIATHPKERACGVERCTPTHPLLRARVGLAEGSLPLMISSSHHDIDDDRSRSSSPLAVSIALGTAAVGSGGGGVTGGALVGLYMLSRGAYASTQEKQATCHLLLLGIHTEGKGEAY